MQTSDTNIKGFSLDVNVSAKSHGGPFFEAELYRCYELVPCNLLLGSVGSDYFFLPISIIDESKQMIEVGVAVFGTKIYVFMIWVLF